MQVVLMKLYKKLCTSPFEGCVQRWLHVVGGNAARDRRRRRKARSKHVISIDLELETRHAPIGLEWIGLDDALDLIIKKMKASDQVLAGVWLEKQRGCTVPSIVDLGKRLGLSPNTVRNRLAGMRDRLRVALERLWGDGPGLAPI